MMNNKNVICVPESALIAGEDGAEEPMAGDVVDFNGTAKIDRIEDGVVYMSVQTVGDEDVVSNKEKSAKDMNEDELETAMKLEAGEEKEY